MKPWRTFFNGYSKPQLNPASTIAMEGPIDSTNSEPKYRQIPLKFTVNRALMNLQSKEAYYLNRKT